MKKTIALLLLILCFSALFTGCDKRSKEFEQLITVRDTETGATATFGDSRQSIDEAFELTDVTSQGKGIYSDCLFVSYVDDIAITFQSFNNTRFELVGYEYFDFDADECVYEDTVMFGGDSCYYICFDKEYTPFVYVKSSSEAAFWLIITFEDGENCGFEIRNQALGEELHSANA